MDSIATTWKVKHLREDTVRLQQIDLAMARSIESATKDESFLFKEITIENAPHQYENDSFYERECYIRNPPPGTATFIVLVHDRRYSEPDELK